MKHVIILQGKKFISSKRASQISDYSGDYIGQLCRSKKIDSKMIGHVWFVAEESLLAHMEKSSSTEALKNRTENFKKSVAKETTKAKKEATSNGHSDEGRISSKEAALKYGYTNDYLGQLCRAGKLDGKMFGNTWFIAEASILAHKERIAREDEATADVSERASLQSINPAPVFIEESETMEAEHAATGFEASFIVSPISEQNVLVISKSEAAVPEIVEREVKLPVRSAFVLRKRYVGAGALLACAAIVLASVFLRAARPSAVVNRPVLGALVGAVESLTALIGSGYAHLTSVSVPVEQSASVGSIETAAAASTSSPSAGLAVVPSSGSAETDAARMNAIRNAFSDDVSVRPDTDGGAGVITPVFSKSGGKQYMYVLVPVTATSTKK